MRHILLSLLCLIVAGIARAYEPVEGTFVTDGFVFQRMNNKEVRILGPLDYPQSTNDKVLYHYQDIKYLVVPEKVKEPATGKEYAVKEAELTWTEYPIEELILPEGIKDLSVYSLRGVSKMNIPENVERLFLSNLLITELALPQSLKELIPTCDPVISWLDIAKLCIPEGVSMLDHAVQYCDKLETLELKGTETMICSICTLPALKKLFFSPNIKSIEMSVCNVSVEEIWFPSDGNEYPWEIDHWSFSECKPKAIYCARPNPPTFDQDLTQTFRPGIDDERVMFGGPEGMKDIILYVRPECVEAYRATPNWGLMDIRPYDFQNDLPLTEADTTNDGDGKLYDLGGRHVTADKPAPGIYISNGRKTVVR